MNKRKFNKVFQKIQEEAKLDYAITNTDSFGDCNTCVNDALVSRYGQESKGIFAKHWTRGMNASGPWSKQKKIYVAHDITEEQANILIKCFKESGYNVTPTFYNPMKCFVISEKDESEDLKDIMKDCLETRGYILSEDKLSELWQIYEDCQEWSENNEMLTGTTFDEVEDFVKHSPCVDDVLGKQVRDDY